LLVYRFVLALVLTLASCAFVAACTADLLPEPDASIAERGGQDVDTGSLSAGDADRFSATPISDRPSLDASAPSTRPSSVDAGEARLDPSDAQPASDEDAGSAPSASNEPTPASAEHPPGDVTSPPAAARPAPIHRYDFVGMGELALDSIGRAHGELMGGAELEGGSVRLDGMDDHVRLPGGLLSELQSTTLLLWMEWNGGEACWQRAFDFSATSLERERAGLITHVDSSLFLAVTHCPSNTPAGGYIDGEGTEFTPAPEPLPAPGAVQVGLVFDADASELRVIVDGRIVAKGATRLRLERLQDDYGFLGRSSFANDPALAGQLLEFRIYDRALDEATLKAVFDAGPDSI
jgi:Concanavalin A-like lectin/glucanases superfamily